MSFDSKRKVEMDETPEAPGEESPTHQCCTKFSELMKKELDANMERKKGRESWLAIAPMDHVLQVYYHTGKLQIAVKALEVMTKSGDASRSRLQAQEAEVIEYAADVANHAMMVLDALDKLGIPRPKPKKSESNKNRASLAEMITEIHKSVEEYDDGY